VCVAILDLAFCTVSAFFAIWYFSASTTFVGLGVGKGAGCSKHLAVVGEGVDSDELLVVNSEGDGSDKLHVVASEGFSYDEFLGVEGGVSCSGELHVTAGGEGVSGD
jgi:hypothetical protein